MAYAKNSQLHPNPASTDIEESASRIAVALESIAANLQKLANPPILVSSDLKDSKPGSITYVKE